MSNHLKILGAPSVQPVATHVPAESWLYLLVGSTGAGKSSFVEALAGGPGALGISKDQLAGFTQQVTAYLVSNVTSGGHPVYLIDTPGFSDTKISELEIIQMVRKLQEENRIDYIDVIFYFTPVTDTRVPGSKRKTIDMLKSLLRPSDSDVIPKITFVTTMWDTLNNDRSRQRAESNLVQLRDHILKYPVAQFWNTRSSALQIMNAFNETCSDLRIAIPIESPHLYQDLHERITGALEQKKTIDSDLFQAELERNVELKAISMANKRENEETLIKFIAQYACFALPPSGFEHAAQHLRRAIASQVIPINCRVAYIFHLWAQGHAFDPDTPTPLIFTVNYNVRHALNMVKEVGAKLVRRR